MLTLYATGSAFQCFNDTANVIFDKAFTSKCSSSLSYWLAFLGMALVPMLTDDSAETQSQEGASAVSRMAFLSHGLLTSYLIYLGHGFQL